MKRSRFALLVVASGVLWTSAASAHIKLRSPTSRDPNNEQKSAPCGPDGDLPRGTSMMMLAPGAKLTVMWDETIQHPGHFRIAFDNDGQDFPDPTGFEDIGTTGKDLGKGVTILLDGIADKTGPFIGNTPYTAEVTMPDIECENCTLQLIQVMTDKAPYGNGDDIYHECANIVLRRVAGGTGGAGGAAPAAGSGAGAGGAAAGSGGAGAGGAMSVAGSGAAGTPAAGSGAAGSPAAGSSAAGSAAAGSGAAGSPGVGSGAAGTGTTSGAAGIGMQPSGVSAAGAGPIVDPGVPPAPPSDDGGCHVVAAGASGVGPGFGAIAVALASLLLAALRTRRVSLRRERSRRA